MIVLDSSVLIAYYNQRDGRHLKALQQMEDFVAGRWGRGLLLEYVVLETLTVLMVRRDLDFAIRVGKLLGEAKEFDFVPCSGFFHQALWSFSHQSKTKLSFTDATLVITALSKAEGNILTFDEEFRKVPGLNIV